MCLLPTVNRLTMQFKRGENTCFSRRSRIPGQSARRNRALVRESIRNPENFVDGTFEMSHTFEMPDRPVKTFLHRVHLHKIAAKKKYQ